MTPKRSSAAVEGTGPGVPAPPVHLVSGDDPSLVDEAARSLLAQVHPGADHALSVEEYRCGDNGVAAAIDAARTVPFLTGHRIVVVRDVGAMESSEVDLVVDYLADPSPTATVVLVGGSGRVPAKVAKAVATAQGIVVNASLPGGAKARSEWLSERLSGAEVRLDARARAVLAEHLGEDMDRLGGILATLASAFGAGARIGEEELEPFLGGAGDVPPWDLTDAVDAGDTAGALGALSRMMTAGERHALVVMSILHRHYSMMLALDGADVSDDADAARLLGVRSPFVAGKVRLQSRRLGSERIGRAIMLLSDGDLDLRGATGWKPELVMEVLVARLSKLASPAGRPRVRAATR